MKIAKLCRYAFTLMVAALVMPAAAQDVATLQEERAFAQEMLPQLRAAFPEGDLRIDDEEPLVVHLENDPETEEALFNLHRVFSYCLQNAAKDCDVLKREFVEGLVQNIASLDEERTAADLRIILRDSQYVSYLLEIGREDLSAQPMRQVGSDLFALLALNSENTIAIVMGPELEDFGLTEEEAWALAQQQTRAIIPPLPDASSIGDQLSIFADQEYLPGMFYPASDWQTIAQQVGPDLFMFVLSDLLVGTGAMPDGPRLDELRALVREDCLAAPRCISPNVYRWRDGQWMAMSAESSSASTAITPPK